MKTWENKEPADWVSLTSRIMNGNDGAMEELYCRLFADGIKRFFRRKLGSNDVDDCVHNSFITVVAAIQAGKIREPRFLQSYVWTVAQHQVSLAIRHLVHRRNDHIDWCDLALFALDRRGDPEEMLMARERGDTANQALAGLSRRDRELLVRVYYNEQSGSEVCTDMRMTVRQLYQLKSRALARFGELGKQIVGATVRGEGPAALEPVERIRSILRRSALRGPDSARIAVGDLELDEGTRAVWRRGIAVDLTTCEFDLLSALMRVAGNAVRREALVRIVLGREFSAFNRRIDTHICNLRRKLGPLEGGGQRIRGVRGVGYLYKTIPTLPGFSLPAGISIDQKSPSLPAQAPVAIGSGTITIKPEIPRFPIH
jgi:RNA polymerase sigma factor (sigma-70 family)